MSRTYAVGDIHGRFDLLSEALKAIAADSPEGGRVVFLGDYIDRGAQSRQVLETLMAGPPPGWRWKCLKGNHEDMMVAAIRGPDHADMWVGNGGAATLQSFADAPASALEEAVEWCDRLPISACDGRRIFVHAGVDPTKSVSDQTEAMLLWSRLQKHQDCQHPEGHIVHGHTPFRDGPILLQGRSNIDTGAFWTGVLTVAVFDDDKDGGPVCCLLVTVAPPHHATERVTG